MVPGRVESSDLNPGTLGNIFIHTAGPLIHGMGNHWAENKEELMHDSYMNSSINPYININLAQNGLFLF